MQEPGSPLVPLDPSRFREMVEKQQVATQQQQQHQQNIPSASPLAQQQQHPLANQYYRENLSRTQSASSIGSAESSGSVAVQSGDVASQFQQQMSPQYSPHVGTPQQRFWYPHAHSSPRSAYCGQPPPPPPPPPAPAPSSSQISAQQPMTPQPVRTPQSASSVGSPRMALPASHTPGSQVMSPDIMQSSPGSARSPMGSPVQGQPPPVGVFPGQQPRLRSALPHLPNPQQPIYQHSHQMSYPPTYQQPQQTAYSPNYSVMHMVPAGAPQQQYTRPYMGAIRPGMVIPQQQPQPMPQPGMAPARPQMVRPPHYMVPRPPGMPLGHPAGGQLPPGAYQDHGAIRNPAQVQPCQPQHPSVTLQHSGYGMPGGFGPPMTPQVSYMQAPPDDGTGGHFMVSQAPQRYQIAPQQMGKPPGGMMSPPLSQRHPGMPPGAIYGTQYHAGPAPPQQYTSGGANLNSQQAVALATPVSPVAATGIQRQSSVVLQQKQHQIQQQQQQPQSQPLRFPQLHPQQQPNVLYSPQLTLHQQPNRPTGPSGVVLPQPFQHPAAPLQQPVDVGQQIRQGTPFVTVGQGQQQLAPRMVQHGQVVVQQQVQQPQQQQEMKVQFYSHEPHVNVPPEMCLLGGVFLIVDYDRILDQKEVGDWRLVITLHGGEVETVYTAKCTHIICESLRHPVVQQALKEGKRCVTAQWLNDCLLQKRMQPPWKAVHFPSPYGDNKPCKNKIFTACGFDANERSCLKQMIMAVGGRYTSYLTRHNHFLIAKWYSLEDAKIAKALEWKVQIVNVHFLTELFLGQGTVLQNISNPKYHQFLPRELMQQQHPNGVDPFRIDPALLPLLMSAWRIPITFTNECWKNALERKQKIENDDGKIFPHKKLKLSPAPEDSEIENRRRSLALQTNAVPRICFTGLYPAEMDNLTRKALWLGGEVVADVKNCTHMVACDLKRTQKLLDGVAMGKLVVTPLWIRQSYKQQQFVDALEYLVKDEGNEKFFGFNLKLSIYRARQGKLFQNVAFYLTPSVQPYPSVLRDLVQTAGGTVLHQRPPVKRILELQQQGGQFVVITCDNDLHLCQSLLDAGIAVHSAEFVLTGILRQEVDFASYKLEPRQNENSTKTGREG